MISKANAIVTGGASGLGYAVADFIVGQGGRVALLDVNEEQGKHVERQFGDQVVYIFCDVTSETSIEQALNQTVEQFAFINLAVNCAGIVTGQRVVGREELLPVDTFKRVVDINLNGTFMVCRGAANIMQHNEPNGEDGERGVIINTASVAAFEGQIGQVPYAASKGGVASMTLPLAREFAAFGVRVMTIAPGIFATPMFDSFAPDVQAGLVADSVFPKRAGKPHEYAKLVAHIFENPMLNGEVIRLDGASRMPAKSRPK